MLPCKHRCRRHWYYSMPPVNSGKPRSRTGAMIMLTLIKWSNTFSKSSILPSWNGYTPLIHYRGISAQHVVSTWNHETGIPTGNFHFVSHSALIDSWCGLLTSKASPSIQSVLITLTIFNSNTDELENILSKKPMTRKMRDSVQRRRKTKKKTAASL